jgi:hypothetical protein
MTEREGKSSPSTQRTLLGHCAGLFPMAPVVSTPSLSYSIGISSASAGGEKEEENDCAADEEEKDEEAPLPRPRSRRFSLPPPLRWAGNGPIAIGWEEKRELIIVRQDTSEGKRWHADGLTSKEWETRQSQADTHSPPTPAARRGCRWQRRGKTKPPLLLLLRTPVLVM